MPLITLGLRTYELYGAGSLAGIIANICVTTIGVDGNLRGYRHADHIDGALGEISPNATFEGEDIFEFTWDVVTGDWILSFGDGTLKLPNVKFVLIVHPDAPDGNVSLWDDTATSYLFSDLELAQSVDEDETQGCFLIGFVPYVAVIYSFSDILRGTKV